MLDPATHNGQTVEHIETHVSHIFLAGDDVYKMKRAVRLPFVDFSTLDRRGATCRAEILVNSRTAAAIYRDVVAITCHDGVLAFNGRGPVVEWLVQMRRFDDSLLFDRLAQRHELTDARIIGLADAVAALHLSEAPSAFGDDPFSRMFRDLVTNLTNETVDTVVAEAVTCWTDCAERAYRENREQIAARALAGHVRHCHGDLHLRNICEVDGQVCLFDALEFDLDLATTDTLYDVAFPLMDLLHRGLKRQASLALGRYMGAVRDYDGLPVLPLFMSTRAAVRALVAMLSPAGHVEAMDYLDLATGLLAPAPDPCLIAIGGRSGTGKTTVARMLAAAHPGPFGAVVIRSDVTRKRIAGIGPEDRLPASAYTGMASDAVHARMVTDARDALRAGACVILDATFLDADARARCAEIAEGEGVPFRGVWLTAEDAVLEARITDRGNDASDANLSVLHSQQEPQVIGNWRIVDVGEWEDENRLPPAIVKAAS